MAKLIVTDPKNVTPPPPWEREEFHWREVPAVLKYWLGRSFTPDTVYDWISKGKNKQDGKARAYLKARKIAGLLYVKRADLRAFIEAT